MNLNLHKLDQTQRNEAIGQELYEIVRKKHDKPGLIITMLLECTDEELVGFLADPDSIDSTIAECQSFLESKASPNHSTSRHVSNLDSPNSLQNSNASPTSTGSDPGLLSPPQRSNLSLTLGGRAVNDQPQ